MSVQASNHFVQDVLYSNGTNARARTQTHKHKHQLRLSRIVQEKQELSLARSLVNTQRAERSPAFNSTFAITQRSRSDGHARTFIDTRAHINAVHFCRWIHYRSGKCSGAAGGGNEGGLAQRIIRDAGEKKKQKSKKEFIMHCSALHNCTIRITASPLELWPRSEAAAHMVERSEGSRCCCCCCWCRMSCDISAENANGN